MTKVRSVMEEITYYLAHCNSYLERQTIVKPPYTFAKLHVKNTAFYGVGFSKCNPTDNFDSMRGIFIAEGRAIKDLADSIVRMGKTYEDVYKLARLLEPSCVGHEQTISVGGVTFPH